MNNGRHYVTLLNLKTTSGLSILMHGVISLPDATCDKSKKSVFQYLVFMSACLS